MVEGLLAGEGAAGHGQLKRLVHAGRQAGLHFTIVNNLAVFSYNGNVIVTFFFYTIIQYFIISTTCFPTYLNLNKHWRSTLGTQRGKSCWRLSSSPGSRSTAGAPPVSRPPPGRWTSRTCTGTLRGPPYDLIRSSWHLKLSARGKCCSWISSSIQHRLSCGRKADTASEVMFTREVVTPTWVTRPAVYTTHD